MNRRRVSGTQKNPSIMAGFSVGTSLTANRSRVSPLALKAVRQ